MTQSITVYTYKSLTWYFKILHTKKLTMNRKTYRESIQLMKASKHYVMYRYDVYVSIQVFV